ncbi:WhiB family transcriptional regulator [Streptomyces sp. NPDC044984]|uniref:WhiB family transcriptional regulator n=1 Tax=Streptomyces sp. NPDC044984 TaxID=3154335 RepID=UPI0033DFA899
MDWCEKASCRDVDPDLFFPIGDSGPTLLQIDEAKAVCHRCPVMGECLAQALTADPVEGIWGGTTEGERRAMGRRPAGPSGGTAAAPV